MKTELDARANECSEANESSNARKYNKILAPEPAGGGRRESFWISEFNRWLSFNYLEWKHFQYINLPCLLK